MILNSICVWEILKYTSWNCAPQGLILSTNGSCMFLEPTGNVWVIYIGNQYSVFAWRQLNLLSSDNHHRIFWRVCLWITWIKCQYELRFSSMLTYLNSFEGAWGYFTLNTSSSHNVPFTRHTSPRCTTPPPPIQTLTSYPGQPDT